MSHEHYFKKCPYDEIDVYRILKLFNVTDPCIQHAIKKLLCVGIRGAKDEIKDVQEAIDSLTRWLDMMNEELTIPKKLTIEEIQQLENQFQNLIRKTEND